MIMQVALKVNVGLSVKLSKEVVEYGIKVVLVLNEPAE